jgi:hypothetical protein
VLWANFPAPLELHAHTLELLVEARQAGAQSLLGEGPSSLVRKLTRISALPARVGIQQVAAGLRLRR